MKILVRNLSVLSIALFCFVLPAQNQVAENQLEDDIIEEKIISVDVKSSESNAVFASKSDKKNYDILVTTANELYFKINYIEAAEFYEKALKLTNAPEQNVLERVGNCYYFNTKMKKALQWYTKLYDAYGDTLSSDYLFRYMHALKGNNKYAKSKNIRRIYNSKRRKDNSNKEATDDKKLDSLLTIYSSISIKNLKLNSRLAHFSPAYYGDKIVFSSSSSKKKSYNWDGFPYLDLYVANIDSSTQEFENPSSFSKKLNTKYHEASISFSENQKTIYFTRNNHKKKNTIQEQGVNHLMILKSELKGDKWSKPKVLPFNDKNYSYGHPALSPNGKKLYFVSNMPGSLGATDIFVVDVFEDGSYSSPKNLGEKINTSKREMFPYMVDNELYFSSDGHLGLGGLDLFTSTFTEKGFSAVKNLGKPINSNKDDFSYIINKKNNTGYFASNRAGGRGGDDIYSFKYNKDEKIIVEEKEEISEAIITVDTLNISPIVVAENINPVPTDKTIEKAVKVKEEVSPKEAAITAAEVPSEVTNENGVKKIKFENVLFGFDKSYLTNYAKQELRKVVAYLNENTVSKIKIASHTDARGSNVYNKYLSQKRAESTKEFLLANGISSDRIVSATGHGEEQLINDCEDGIPCSKTAHYKNRRSEIIILD